jgi:cell fate (sporulation/competence/biofilm development) regulator YlbF (YheA/YmcA/DUF963 family)
MEAILELAEKLGKQVAADPRGQNFAKARAAFEANLEARRLVGDYEKQQQKMAELEMSGKPIEPEDKRRLAALHQNVTAHPVLKDLMKAQADYLEMMTLISERIEREALGAPAE